MYFKGDTVRITGNLPQKNALVMVTDSGARIPADWLRVNLGEDHEDVSISPNAVELVSMGKALRVHPNMTLLQFLETGGEIILPNGAWLRGDPIRHYIEHGVSDGENLGLWNLDKQGVLNAVSSIEEVLEGQES